MAFPPLSPARPRRHFPPPLEQLEGRRLLSVTVFSDGFEGPTLAGWNVHTYAGGGSAPTWGVSTTEVYGGAHSAYGTGPGRNTYANDQHTGMTRQNVSLAGYGTASLSFKYFINTEAGYDFFSVNVLGANGKTINLFRDSGDDRAVGWHSKTLSLTAFAGQSGLGIEFRFDSDASLVNDAPSGVWVDDVKLTADVRPSTATVRGAVFDDGNGNHARDAGEKPLAGWVVFLDQNQNGRRDSGEWWRVTDDAGRYTFAGLNPGTYYVAEDVRSGYAQTAPARSSVISASQFNIDVHFDDDSLTGAQRSAVTAAARRWSSVIVGDLPSVTDGGVTIDDLLVDFSAQDIDGKGGVLAQSSPSAFRDSTGPGAGLPYRGLVEVDSADLASLTSGGQLQTVLTHEIAHALGFGTLWEQEGLLADAGGSNPRFTGPVATAQYDAIFGRTDKAVPVENEGGPGTQDEHWRESVFGNELMTGYVNSGANPLSRVTVGSLADLGYVVDLSAADAYAPPGKTAPATPAGVEIPVTVSAGQVRGAPDFGNRLTNRLPTIAQLSDAPDPSAAGSTITLTALGAADADGSVVKVGFYHETNGVPGLQTGTGGDTLLGSDADKTDGFSLVVGTAGLAPGAYTYYALATDNGGASSASGTSAAWTTHTLQAPAGISGTVYRDADNDGVHDPAEVGLPGVKVYVDANRNDRFDAGERSALTDLAGRYTLSSLAAGTYTVRFVAPAGYVRTAPSSGRQVVQVGAGKTASGKDFGAIQAGAITGRVFNDLNANGVKDTTDTGAAGVRVFLDANNNGILDAGETSVLTESSGTFSFTGVRPGTRVVRFVMPSGWRLSSKFTYYTVNVGAGQTQTGINFGITKSA